MEFKIDRDVLRVELAKAAGTVSSKETTPVLKNFLIKAVNGTLRVMSTDMQLGAITELTMVDPSTKKSNIVVDGAIAAPAQKMLDIAASAPQGFISLKLEGITLTVLGGYKDSTPEGQPLAEPTSQAKWIIHCMETNAFPDMPEFDPTTAVTVSRETFVAGLDQISFACAKSELKKNLMAVFINNGNMYSTDGHRACRRKFESEHPVVDYSIPDGAVKLLVSLLRDSSAPTLQLCKTQSHLLFKIGDDLYNARKLEQGFPDLEKNVIAATNVYEDKLIIPRRQLIDAIKRAQVTSEENFMMTMKLTKDGGVTRLILTTKNNVDDQYEEIIEGPSLTWSGAPFERSLNWSFLEDVLNVVTDEAFSILMGEDKPNRPSMYRIEEGGFMCVIMPLRIRKDTLGRDEKLHKRVAEHADKMRTDQVLAGGTP